MPTPPAPTRLRLYRWPVTDDLPTAPRLRYRIGINTDELIGQSLDRTRRALDDKLPKLEKARRATIKVTLLVLETADLQLTNPWTVHSDVRRHIEEAQLPAPDHIVLVIETLDEVPSIAFIFRQNGKWLDRPVMADGHQGD
jgi:hypothetical protein